MKSHSILSALTALLVIPATISSCKEESRLARELPGEWSGTPENFTDNTAITATIIETLSIGEPTSSSPVSGQVTITGVISTTTQLVGDTTFVEPVTLSAGAVSSVQATYRFIDDDEIILTFDASTLTVTVDPKAVTYATPVLTPDAQPRLEALRPSFCNTIQSSILHTLSTRYSGSRHLDDVEIKGDVLQFEINDMPYAYMRSDEVASKADDLSGDLISE